jgi:hypothetical protein
MDSNIDNGIKVSEDVHSDSDLKRMISKSLNKKYYIVYLCDYLSIIKEQFSTYG